MGKFNFVQNVFNRGELSPRSKGRQDLKEYFQGLATQENFLTQDQGGLIKRPGTTLEIDLGASASEPIIKMIPFVFNQEESFFILVGQAVNMSVYKNDGTIQVLRNFIDTPLLTKPAKGYKYSQSGDILVITYDEEEDTTESIRKTPTIFVIRTEANEFMAYPYIHPEFIRTVAAENLGFPSIIKFSPAISVPYRIGNSDPDLKMYVDNVAIGPSRTLFCVDNTNTPAAFFRSGHAFLSSGTGSTFVAEQIGAFFRVDKGLVSGVCWPSAVWPDDLVVSGLVNTINDTLDIVAHTYLNGDEVELGLATLPGFVIDGYTYNATTLKHENDITGSTTVYARNEGVNTISLFASLADLAIGTPATRIDIITGGNGVRVTPLKKSSIEVTIEVAFEATLTSAANSTDDWRESAYSNHRGFPKSSVFHEQRLALAGIPGSPDTIYMSQVGNVVNFMDDKFNQDLTSPTTATYSTFRANIFGDPKETDPLQFKIASKQANIIQWMESQRDLTVGSLGAEYVVTGGDKIISRESILIKKQTEQGSTNVESITVGNSVLFFQRDGKKLREFKYNESNGSFISNNISVLSDHMVYKGFDGVASSSFNNARFTEIYYHPSRSTVWMVNTSSQLIGCTLSKEADVLAWHYQPMRAGDVVVSICVLPNANRTTDDLWMVTRRAVNGAFKLFIEKMTETFEHDFLENTSAFESDIPVFSDCAVPVTLVAATAVVTGLGHLEGETVKILAGNVIEADKVVAGGQITMDNAYAIGTRIVVGLPYTAKLTTLDLEAGADFGSSQGNIGRIDKITARLYKSMGGSYGKPAAALPEPLEYDTATALFTGQKELFLTTTPSLSQQVEITHSDPTPFNVLSLSYRGVSYD